MMNGLDAEEVKLFTRRGWEISETNALQYFTLMAAMDIFVERNKRYKDVWKGSGWMGSMFDIRKKVTRMWVTFWRRDEGMSAPEESECDDAFDVINYCVFFIRNVRDKNRFGTWS